MNFFRRNKKIRIMRKYILLLIFITSSLAVFSQGETHYTQFMHNKLAINPAYAGSKEVMSFTTLYRNQWAGIDGAPTTYTLNAHTPFFDNRAGGGISIVGDRHGFYQTINIGLNYAYRMPLGNNRTLSIGLSGQMEYGKVDFTMIDPADQDDDIPMNNDVRLNPNFGFGAYYSHPKFYLGLSVPNVLKTTLYTDESTVDLGRVRTYHFMAGYMTRLSNSIQFKPAILISYNPSAPIEVDMNASFLLLDQVWIGASYRLGDSVDAMFQYQFNSQLKAGVAVDITTSELSQYSPGSFEVMLEYNLDYQGKGMNHLRFF